MPPGVGYLFGADPRRGLLSGQRRPDDPQPIPDLPHPPAVPESARGNFAYANQGNSFRDILARLFTGQNQTLLEGPTAERATRQALTQAGIAGLAAANQPGGNLGQTLAAMMGQGHQAGAQARQQAAMQQLSQGGLGVDTLHAMFQNAVAQGDADGARNLATVIQSVESARRPRATQSRTVNLLNEEDGREHIYLIDNEGNVIRDLGVAPQSESSRISTGLTPSPVVDPETGEITYKIFNRDTRQFEDVEGGAPPPPAGSEGERKAAAFLQFAPRAKEFVDSITNAPGRVEQALSDRGIREFTDAEQQQLDIAGAALAEAWLRMTTGAAYNEREFQTARNLFVPRPGDRRETLEAKRQNRDALMEMLRSQAGRLGSQAGAAPAPNTGTGAGTGGNTAEGLFDDLIPGGN